MARRYVYIIEYNKVAISKEGYDSLEKAQDYIKLNNPGIFEITPFYYSMGNNSGEYRILEIQIK